MTSKRPASAAGGEEFGQSPEELFNNAPTALMVLDRDLQVLWRIGKISEHVMFKEADYFGPPSRPPALSGRCGLTGEGLQRIGYLFALWQIVEGG